MEVPIGIRFGRLKMIFQRTGRMCQEDYFECINIKKRVKEKLKKLKRKENWQYYKHVCGMRGYKNDSNNTW